MRSLPTPPERDRCLSEGEQYGDSWVLDEADFLIVAPGKANVGVHSATAGFCFVLAVAAALVAVVESDLERVLISAISAPCLVFWGLSVIASGRMWFWLKLSDTGFIYERGGAWFPLRPLSLEGPLTDISAASLRSVKAGWYDVAVALGGRRVALARERRERAQRLCDGLNQRIIPMWRQECDK
jgi:hypothetical protein